MAAGPVAIATAPEMKISLIAALDKNRVIGTRNSLPWHLPSDLAFFKRTTLGKPILMGRKTWESLPGLLPERPHLVMTRDTGYQADGADVVHSVIEALNTAVRHGDELMVVGGEQVYRLFLPLADQLYLTHVDTEVEGDAWFPALAEEDWREISREDHPPDERNPLAHTFVCYQRCLPGQVCASGDGE